MHKTLHQIIKNNTYWCKNREDVRQQLHKELKELLLDGCCAIVKLVEAGLPPKEIREHIEKICEK